MKHAVLGAGAIGGLMATALGSIGEDITLIVRPEKLAGYPQRLTLEQPSGTITATARITAVLTEPVDVLWIATKTYQLETALESIKASPGIVVPLLNGVEHIPVLRARFGDERVVPATIVVEAERIGEGRFAQRSGVRLNIADSGQALLARVLTRLHEQCAFSGSFFDNVAKLLWTKLSFLGPFALVTSASGKNKGEIFADPEWRAKLDSAVAETVAVANASGADIDVAKIQNGFEAFNGTVRSSMAKDLVAGRRLELDGIAGAIVRGGDKHGIPVPVTKELMAVIESKVNSRH
jgi:2-dehydropantoate 2-reductase